MSSEDIRSLAQRLVDQSRTALPAEIERFDEQQLKADVTLLHRNEKNENPTIVDVPVSVVRAGGFVIRPPYSQGDVVLLLFSDKDLEGVLFDGESRPPTRVQNNQLDYAIVIGGLSVHTETINLDGEADSIQIATEDNSGRIELQTDGTLIIDSGSVKLGDQGSLEKLVQATVQDAINTHTHTGNAGSPTSQPIESPLVTDDDLTSETEGS